MVKRKSENFEEQSSEEQSAFPEMRLRLQEILFDTITEYIDSGGSIEKGVDDIISAYVAKLDRMTEKDRDLLHLNLATAYLHELNFLLAHGYLMRRNERIQ